MDIRRAFLDANGVSRSGRLDIGPFLLHNADFRSARIINANFSETHFLGSDFRMAQLGGSAFDEVHLASCDLRGADLAHIDWGGSSVQDADVTTFVDTSGEIIRTDLSRAGLTRNELDSMKGDSETIIPDHLERAEYWPEFEWPEREPATAPFDLQNEPEPKTVESTRTLANQAKNASPIQIMVRARPRSELRKALANSYPDVQDLAQYLMQQVQAERTLHEQIPMPNSEPALSEHNARGNFLAETEAALIQLDTALPNTPDENLSDAKIDS